jgi:hypothetical protein
LSRIEPTQHCPAPSASRPALVSTRGTERRRRRSDDPITALHYQLSAARTAGKLEAVVLVDDRGCLVAGAGAWPICEELAAYAPLLAEPAVIATAAVGTRIASLSTEVEVQTVALDGAEALLATRGGGADRSAFILRAAAGCRRIFHEGSKAAM